MSLNDIRENVRIYVHRVTRTELIVGEADKNSACAMDIIWDELRRNDVDINKETQKRHSFILTLRRPSIE